MVTHARVLDWSSADLQLVWHSPNTIRRPDAIYLKLWGLIHTINTTNTQYEQQLHDCQARNDTRQLPIIQSHLSAKLDHYPSDHFPLIAFHPTDCSYHDIKLVQGQNIAITIVFGGMFAFKAQDWLNWFAKRMTLENTGFSIQSISQIRYHSQKLPKIATTFSSPKQTITNINEISKEITFLLDTPANLSPLNKQEEQDTATLSKAESYSHLILEHSKKRLCDWFPEQQGYIKSWFDTHQQILFDSPICIYQLYEKHGIKSKSKSSKRHPDGSYKVQHHKGTVGWLTLKGAWTQIDGFWQIMQSIHLHGQRKNINGLGYILPLDKALHPPLDLWHRHISQKSQILHAIREVLENYELDPELNEKGKILEEEAMCEILHTQLTTGSYTPKPSHAFYIPKPHGGSRRIEQLEQTDMVVHRLVFNSIARMIDGYQSPLSLGYRRGYSRQMARDKIQQLINEGFGWVVEADIEAFFDNVPYDKLWQRLSTILPQQESQTIELIKTLMTAPYDIKGKKPKGIKGIKIRNGSNRINIIEREKGLMQGSPLSPPLANLYLSQLDHDLQHDMKNEHIVFIRYADDVLIFCRGQSDAIEIKDWLGDQLQELGLNLSFEKTTITQVKSGFEFLGYRFDAEGSDDKSIVPILRQRKPVLITGNGSAGRKYLGINGNALEVRERRPSKKGRTRTTSLYLVELIPLRRISQLIIMGNHSLSSPLLSACAKAKVSVHLVNRYGFQVGTMTPTNADFYAISAKQYARHQSLKRADVQAIATDIVCAKINNYQTWIKNSYRKGDAQVTKQLDWIKDKATASTTASELMGYEGQASKICFARLQNSIIDEQKQAFSSRRRARGGVDRLNSMLNFGYYWLFTRISALLHAHGLNPYLSYLHESEQSYETLVYDLMEMFRVQVDKTVLRLINRKQIQAHSFVLNEGGNTPNSKKKSKGWKLTNQAIHLFTNQLQATFASKINHTYIEDIILIQVRTVLQWAVEGKSLVWFYWYPDSDNAEFRLNSEEQQSIVIDHLADDDNSSKNNDDKDDKKMLNQT